ncbi:MAG: PH domain-containing protein, partial [Rhodocyclaceae bacterium]|nr:PH domain-containing protein [Rhodocyclaceae bacterium]
MNRDWWMPLVQWTVWGIAMAVVMGWVAKSRLRQRPDSERRTLRHPISTLVIGVVGAAFFFGIAIASNTIGKNPTATVWTTALFIAFGLASVPMIADYFFARHRVSDAGIEYGRMMGQRGNLQWSEVKSVRFAPVAKWFVLEGSSGVKVRVSALLLGLPDFAHLVLLHVPT